MAATVSATFFDYSGIEGKPGEIRQTARERKQGKEARGKEVRIVYKTDSNSPEKTPREESAGSP